MIARQYLIPLRCEFNNLKRNGKTVTTPLFNVIIAKNDYGHPRFAFIISKKVDKRSVIRHQIKRRLADAVSNINLSGDFIFIAKKEIVGKSKQEIADSARKALNP